MGSTFPSALRIAPPSEPTISTLTWRSWPLVDRARSSWVIVVGVLAVGVFAWYASESLLLGVLALAAVAITLWQFFVPVWYEIGPLGLGTSALGRSRLLAWHAVRSYQLRPSGVAFHRRAQPAPIDALRSTFMPFPADADDALLALRAYLPHALELPTSTGAG
jgi:hypothetical protein